MNTNMYALSHSERGWLMISFAFMLSGIIYSLLILRMSGTMTSEVASFGLQVAPILFLFSLSLGFVLLAAGHYVFRLSLRQPAGEEQW